MAAYGYVKFFHIFFMAMWAMSAVGAYIFYLRATIFEVRDNPENEELKKRLVWAYEQFDKTVILEHIAFPLLLITGAILYYLGGWSLAQHWLLVKLVIVIGFFIPLELLDIWISHILGPRITRRRNEFPDEWNSGRALHLKFLLKSSPMIRITVPIVILLAAAKPVLW
ncbi:DUF2269 family protein [Halioxenophilus sp. WMMB6]|uniref:DUF2269 family protein n=1 Tax=Halioxenophilus sp. WMMB6 TaxID=3073815 RepID=UPI00295E363B|nr:DUF2269 family protein [Halioxenophilus sp. WMMB6]